MIDREMSIASQITRISNLVSTLRSNIQAKGVTLANDADLETCVDAVNEISGGGDTPSGYAAEYFTIENTGSYPVNLAMRKRNSASSTNSNYNTTFKYSIDYSFDKQTWTTVDFNLGYNSSNYITTLESGQKIYLRSTTPRLAYKYYSSNSYINFYHFYVPSTNNIGSISVSGNINSLIFGDDFVHPNVATEYAFYNLFYECGYVNIDASNLVLPKYLSKYCCDEMFSSCIRLVAAPALPATTLAPYCYYMMFYNSSLTTAPALPATTLADSCYNRMFYGCSLTTAPALPATTLANNCYAYMFSNCTALTSTPALPATTLANNCYDHIFERCLKLTSAPALPATKLANNCYQYMFYNCSALTSAPVLPATTLASYCYAYMFYGCSKLPSAPVLPATTLANNCYQNMFYNCTSLTTAPALPATTLITYCYDNMFYGCSKLTSAPALPATKLASYCYRSMFYNCTSLTTAPVLPAITLVSGCYAYMFYGCSKLNYIKAMFTTTPTTSYTQAWVQNVSSTGTFVKNSAATWDVTGLTYGIPSGWTVETASS